MNEAWHDRNPMPKRPTVAQRIAWHREHRKHCACRPIPASLRERMGSPGQGRGGSGASRSRRT